MADQSDIGHRPEPGALFSMDAADNAEVVPPDPPRGPESMWSTAAKPAGTDEVVPPDETWPRSHLPPPPPPGWEQVAGAGPFGDRRFDDQLVDDQPVDDDAAWERMAGSTTPGSGARGGFGTGAADRSVWDPVPPTPPGAPGAGGVFSAEPVERGADVIDEADPDTTIAADDEGSSVFASGPAASPFATPEDPWTAWEPDPAAAGESVAAPPPFTRSESAVGAPGAEPLRFDDPTDLVAADQHGYADAVARLRLEDQQRARVPLCICGALLGPGERVVGAVTGQMLGRPAAVVVTQERVLVVNDRRWQPIVDIYRIGEGLQVRGRHDGHVAALSFADDDHLSMVDGITEVDLAVGLASSVRTPKVRDSAGGAEF